MSLFEQSAIRAIVFATLWVVAAVAAEPVRVEPQEASRNLVKKVDPVLPQLAELAGVSGTVVLDATISPEGKVNATKAISGQPILIQSVLNAVRQWQYKPFVQDGQPITVITRITWVFPSRAYSQSQEKASRDFYPALRECYDLISSHKYAEAQGKCSAAVELADQLPPERLLERSDAREILAKALLNQHKITESIPLYEKALEIRASTQGSDHDADFAWNNAALARAYFLAGQLANADPLYARAVSVFEAAIVALPEMRDRYTDGLKKTLQEYAKLKEARGEPERARELRQKAATLPGQLTR